MNDKNIVKNLYPILKLQACWLAALRYAWFYELFSHIKV
jgi:hypothetical protein